MTEAAEPERAGAFYGRRKGKPLRDHQAELVGGLLPRLALDLGRPAPADLRSLFAGPVEDVHLEIGFGGGEHLLHGARGTPGTGFIGVEPFVNGMARVMTALTDAPLGNLRVYDDDATRLLDWLPAASLTGIASTSAMFRPPRVYSSTWAWNRLPPHSSQVP